MTIPIKIVERKDLKEKPDQEQIWDNISNPWKEYRIKKLLIVEEFLKGKKGRIVDLGCGTGRNMIKNNDIEYYGVDFSAGQLKHAKDLIKDDKLNAKLFKSKLNKLPKEFEDEMFDGGLFIAALHCLETKKQRLGALKEFYRVLKKGTEGLLSVWNGEDNRFNGLKGDVYLSWSNEKISHLRFYYIYGKQEFVDLLKSVGFEILEIYKPTFHDRFSKKNWIIRVKK